MSNTSTAKKEYIKRVMTLMEEIDTLKEDIKEVFLEIKSGADALGFEPKEIRQAVSMLRAGPQSVVGKVQKTLNTLREIGDQEALDTMFT